MSGLAGPWWLWGLLLIPALSWLRWRRRNAGSIHFPPLQGREGLGRLGRRRLGLAVLAISEAVLSLLLVVAIARPFSESRFERLDDEGIDIAMVLDVSLSMLAEDFPPNRLAALQEIAQDFLARSGGHRVGIVIFAGDTYVQSPLTDDRTALSSLLESVSVHALNQSEGGGTAIGDALLVATQRLKKQRLEGRDQALILITDGESNLGVDPLLAARYAQEAEIRLYAIGIGSTTPQEVFFQGERVGGETPFLAALDDERLKSLTAEAGGQYFRATDADALGQIFAELSRLESAPLTKRTIVRRAYSAHRWALLGFLVFAVYCAVELMALGRPWR